MIYYKQIMENEIVSIGSVVNGTLPSGFEEITKEEHDTLLAEIIAKAEEEVPEEEPTDFDKGFESGYEQALLDLMELEMESE